MGCAVCTPRFLTTLSKGEIKLKKRQSPKSGTALTERAKDVLFGYGLLLPTFLVFSIVILYPIISAVIRSFCDYTFLTVNKPLKWNDFANYKTIFKNGFLTQLWTTMKFTVGTVGIELVLGMSIALLLNTKIRGRNALRSVFLMPWCIPSIVTALLWSWLFQAQYGIINYVLYGLGLISNPTAEWVLNPSTSLGVVTIAVVWRQTPYMLVMILAGLQSINHDLVEAASIDGANSFRVFWHITLPGIRVVLGNTISEGVSCTLMFAFAAKTPEFARRRDEPLQPYTQKELYAIVLPVEGSRLLASGLQAVESSLIPYTLALYTGSRADAMAQYGSLKGMALPLLFFPFSVLGALSGLLMPEITRAHTKGDTAAMRRLIFTMLRMTGAFSLAAGVGFVLLGAPLAGFIYRDAKVGRYVQLLGFVAPFMYLESMVDGVLKGLGEQLATFRYSLFDSVFRIAAIWLVVPQYGMMGFLGVMAVSNLMTCGLNMRRMMEQIKKPSP